MNLGAIIPVMNPDKIRHSCCTNNSKKRMKKNILIAAAGVIAGTALITYLIKRKKLRASEILNLKRTNTRSHHLTDVFSKAKDHVM